MTATAVVRMSAGEFLEWAAARPAGDRLELDGGVPVAMAPERNRHALAKLDAAVALRDAVRAAGAPCTVFPDGPSLVIDAERVYEPDASVVCGRGVDPDAVVIEAPVVLVEVLSPSTRGVDSHRKLDAYMGLESVRHYLVVDPDQRLVVHHGRETANGPIVTQLLRDGVLRLHPPGIETAIAAFFVSLDQTGR